MRRTAGEKTAAGVADPGLPRPALAAILSFSSSPFFCASGSFFSSSDFVSFSGGFSFFSSGGASDSSIVATTSPIFTSWPWSTLVSSTPAFSATISVETLSVSSVKRASPAFTKSPDFLCQTETTPLVIDSPTAGILTSMAMEQPN
jgi:hypothetical protein